MRRRLLRLVDRADHIQRTLRIVLELVPQNPLAAIERILHAHLFSLETTKLLRSKERLRQKAFQPTRPANRQPIVRGELVQAKHRHDIFQRLILRKRLANLLRQRIVPLTHDARSCHRGIRLQQIDRRIETLACPLAGQHDRRAQMPKDMLRCRIGEVVRWNVYRLNRCDRARMGIGDPLFQSR